MNMPSMLMSKICTGGIAASLVLTSAAAAQQSIPNDFESVDSALDPLFSFFGGVDGFGSSVDVNHSIFAGSSLNVFANFQPDPFFTTAGFALGASNVSGSPLNIESGADTLSITIESPPEGVLSFYITIREDDDGDGMASAASNDDQWETSDVFLSPGINVYNVAAADLVLANEGNGNGVLNLDSTSVMSVAVTFESKASYPGGIIDVPISFHIDHLGVFAGAQELPGSGNAADINGDGIVNGADLADLLAQFGASGNADITNDGIVDGADIAALLANWT